MTSKQEVVAEVMRSIRRVHGELPYATYHMDRLAALCDEIERLRAGLVAAREWLSGWASAEPYIGLIDAALGGSPVDTIATPGATPSGEPSIPSEGSRPRELLVRALKLMTDFHATFSHDEDDPEIRPYTTPAAFRDFVDQHARLLYEEHHLPDETSARQPPKSIATVINNNQPGWTNIVETAPNVTLPVGTKLYDESALISVGCGVADEIWKRQSSVEPSEPRMPLEHYRTENGKLRKAMADLMHKCPRCRAEAKEALSAMTRKAHHPRCELMQPHGHEPPKCTCPSENGT